MLNIMPLNDDNNSDFHQLAQCTWLCMLQTERSAHAKVHIYSHKYNNPVR